MTLSSGDAVRGSGVIVRRLEQGPVTMTVRELLTAMIRSSGNTAANKIISMIGMQSVNEMLDRLGPRRTRLRRVMLDGAAARRGGENVSTPEACEEMRALLAQVQGAFKQGVPGGVDVLSKTGALPGVHTEAGVVRLPRRPFALSVMTAAPPEGRNPIPDVAWTVYKRFARLDGINACGHKVH